MIHLSRYRYQLQLLALCFTVWITLSWTTNYGHCPSDSNTSPVMRSLQAEVQYQDGMGSDSHLPLCTHDILRKYYVEHGYFPGEGHWNGNKFSPAMCRFNTNLNASLLQCFKEKGIKQLLTVGDSNGRRHFVFLMKIMEAAFASINAKSECILVKGETGGIGSKRKKHNPSPSYFARPDLGVTEEWLRTETQGCTSCYSRLYRCSVTDKTGETFNITTEYVSAAHTIDRSLVIENRKEWKDKPQWTAESLPQYLYKVYFKDRYPDLIVISPTFTHEKNMRIPKLKAQIKNLGDIMDAFLPNTTRRIWLTQMPERDEYKPPQYNKRKYFGMSTNEYNENINREMYDVLKSQLVDPDSRVYGSFDNMKIGALVKTWNYDGVHLIDDWYLNAAAMFVDTLCNSKG